MSYAACCLCVCGLFAVASSCMLVSEFALCSQWILVTSFVHRYIYPCVAIAVWGSPLLAFKFMYGSMSFPGLPDPRSDLCSGPRGFGVS